MSEARSSLSRATSYEQIGEFWDAHDLSEHWDETTPIEFDVDIRTEAVYYPIDVTLANGVRSAADSKGVSPQSLLNAWVREKLLEDGA